MGYPQNRAARAAGDSAPAPPATPNPATAALRPAAAAQHAPHSARLRPSAGELTRSEAREELQHRGGNIATLPFTGKRHTGVSFGPVRLGRLENDQLIEVVTWSEQRSGDALIEALKAPVVARFASFLSQPPIRATLSWTVPDRRITITGQRGDQPFGRSSPYQRSLRSCRQNVIAVPAARPRAPAR